MDKIVENINRILVEWNPLNVPENIVFEEYKGYIPLIIQSIDDNLIACLEDILVNQLEIDFDSMNEEHSKDLQQICAKITSVYRVLKNMK